MEIGINRNSYLESYLLKELYIKSGFYIELGVFHQNTVADRNLLGYDTYVR